MFNSYSMWLYSVLLIASISVPLALSFDKKLQFYRQWRYVFPSLFIIALFYIIFDIYLTRLGVWGFNPLYHLNILIFGLPLEEWLFFFIIPYASIFLHESFVLYFPDVHLHRLPAKILSAMLIVLAALVLFFNHDKTYTVYIFTILILVLLPALAGRENVTGRFYITFLIILIPFIIVNAILTGSFLSRVVVWYNDQENLGIRFLTIPVEDFGYAFSLILLNLMLISRLKKRNMNRK